MAFLHLKLHTGPSRLKLHSTGGTLLTHVSDSNPPVVPTEAGFVHPSSLAGLSSAAATEGRA
jgi:hypothetical protein